MAMLQPVNTSTLDGLRERVMNGEQTLNELRREEWQNEVKTFENINNELQDLKSKSDAELKEIQSIWKSQHGDCARSCRCCTCCSDCNAANIYYQENIAPKVRHLNKIQQTLTETKKLLNLSNSWNFETRQEWNGGIDVVYNPITGKTEWKKKWHHGVCGVFNPNTEQIEWKEKWNGDVCGVYNPVTKMVEWKEKWHYGIGGVWNPDKQEIEWMEEWNHGVCGVWNPIQHIVEWKTKWNGGIAGYFDENEGVVKWIDSWHHGVCIIRYNSSTKLFDTSRGCCWDWDDK